MGNEVSLANVENTRQRTPKNMPENVDIIVWKSAPDAKSNEPIEQSPSRSRDSKEDETTKRASNGPEEIPVNGEVDVTGHQSRFDPLVMSILYGREGVKKNKEGQKEESNTQATINGLSVIVHKVVKSDTLQGLALKYNVEASDIKKTNKIWTNRDIFARKELIIPVTPEQYMKYQAEKKASGELSSVDKQNLITKFVEITQCQTEFARHFLVEKAWNFEEALSMYYVQESATGGTTTDTQNAEKGEEIWEDKQGNDFVSPIPDGKGNAQYHSPGEHGVGRVQKSMQDHFRRKEEEIFEI